MRRPPPRRTPASGKGEVKHSITIRRGSRGPVVHNEEQTERFDIPVAPGDESVSVGYDMKFWASDQNHGMTIGVSAHVKLSCGPGLLDQANDVAADLAWKYLNTNSERATKRISSFVDGK